MADAADTAKWREVLAQSHAKGNKKFGGEVFLVASAKMDGKKLL